MTVKRFLLAAAALLVAGSGAPAFAQGYTVTSLPVTCKGTTGDCQRAITVVNPDGSFASGGSANMATGQVSVGTSATLIAAARTGRVRITMTLGAANDCYLGNPGVTSSTGLRIKGVDGANMPLDTSAAVYAVCAATTTISFMELY